METIVQLRNELKAAKERLDRIDSEISDLKWRNVDEALGDRLMLVEARNRCLEEITKLSDMLNSKLDKLNSSNKSQNSAEINVPETTRSKTR